MNLEIKLEGLEDVEKKLLEMPVRSNQAAAGELYQAAEDIIGDAKESYVPVDLSTLKNSGHVQLPVVENGQTTVRAGFGGAAAPYAMAVHEHLSGSSPRSWKVAESQGRPVKFSPAGTGAKYLERPLLAAAPKLAQRIAAAIRKALS